MMVSIFFFNSKVFFNQKYVHFFKHNAIAHLIEYNVV